MRVMVSEQINIRVTPRLRRWIDKNSRMMEQTPAEYVRSLIEKEGEYTAGWEWGSRITQSLERHRKTRRKAVAQ